MKKENKKLAKQRKEAARKKQARNDFFKKALSIGVPSLLLIALIVFCIAAPLIKEAKENDTSNTDIETSVDDTSDDASADTYSTDTSLTVEDGSVVNIDYVGSIDGVEFDGGNTNGAGAQLVIGSHSYIDDFEEQLIGYHPGDSVDVNVTFPDDYHSADLAGKDALFKVVINGIY